MYTDSVQSGDLKNLRIYDISKSVTESRQMLCAQCYNKSHLGFYIFLRRILFLFCHPTLTQFDILRGSKIMRFLKDFRSSFIFFMLTFLRGFPIIDRLILLEPLQTKIIKKNKENKHSLSRDTTDQQILFYH